MIYSNGNFYDLKGCVVTIEKVDGVLSIFSNGATHLTCELDNKVKNYNSSKAVQISNRIEVDRLKAKFSN